jgi:hypothetical protein
MKRTFGIESVLSVTTGRLACPIEDLCDILKFLTGDKLMTHQRPRVQRECSPWLLWWFPVLEQVTTWELDQLLEECKMPRDPPGTPEEACRYWIDIQVSKQKGKLPRMFELEPIPQDDHEHRDPLAELAEMRGTEEGVFMCVVQVAGMAEPVKSMFASTNWN